MREPMIFITSIIMLAITITTLTTLIAVEEIKYTTWEWHTEIKHVTYKLLGQPITENQMSGLLIISILSLIMVIILISIPSNKNK